MGEIAEHKVSLDAFDPLASFPPIVCGLISEASPNLHFKMTTSAASVRVLTASLN